MIVIQFNCFNSICYRRANTIRFINNKCILDFRRIMEFKTQNYSLFK